MGKVGSNEPPQMFCLFYRHQRPPPGSGRSQPGTHGLSISGRVMYSLKSKPENNCITSPLNNQDSCWYPWWQMLSLISNPQFTCLFVSKPQQAAVISCWVALWWRTSEEWYVLKRTLTVWLPAHCTSVPLRSSLCWSEPALHTIAVSGLKITSPLTLVLLADSLSS